MAQTPTISETPSEASEPKSLRATVSQRRLIFIIVGVMLGMLLSAIDQTVVSTAMPTIALHLGGLDHYAWIYTGYMLASTVTVPIYGKLSDLYGRRTFFLLGMVLFLAGSALSGTSQTMTQLIAYRAIQGLGAGAMLPIVQAIIGDVFPPVERGKWVGLMMAVFGLASIVGPTAGGWITDNWGWQWVFYVNMPFGVLALLTAGLALPKQVIRRQHTIDYAGSAALVAGTVPLLLAFSWGGTQYAWGSPQIIGLFAFALVMFVVFIVIEMRTAEPVISPRLFKNSIFTVSVFATFLLSAGMFGAIMFLPMFVQQVIGDSATNSGVVLTPMMLSFIVSSVIGGQLLSRTGRYKVLALISFAVATVGMFLLSRMTIATTEPQVVRDMIITGLGIGVLMSLFTIVVQNAFPFRQLGEVTASLQFFRSMGGTIGVAIMGTILTNRLQSALQANMPSSLTRMLPPDQLAKLQDPQQLMDPSQGAQLQHSLAALGPQGLAILQQLAHAVRLSLADAITSVFLLGAATMVVALLTTFLLREIPLRKSHDTPAESGEEGVGMASVAMH